MSNTLKKLLLASALLAAAQTHTASAQDATYPRIVKTGENVEIDYGPGPRGNVVGGGQVVMSGGGEDRRITHLDAGPTRSDGLIPVLVGGGEDRWVAYVQPHDAGAAETSVLASDPASVSSRAAAAVDRDARGGRRMPGRVAAAAAARATGGRGSP
jgi:hypothetical protein